MTKIRAVLFDLDGVLVDAREWHWEALNMALRLFGYEIGRQEHLTTFDGLPTRKKLAYLSESSSLPRRIAPLINELKQAYTKQLITQYCYPIFHIEYAVARLKREGYRLAVCTNSVRETTDLMLTRSGLLHYFDLTLSNQDCKNPKPAPDVYLDAMQALGVLPDEAAIVEDNEYGVRAGTEAGGHVLRVADPHEVTYWAIRDHIRAVEASR
ncbi:MAG: HAD family hydrolase [Alphaproteobacteria bacterium]